MINEIVENWLVDTEKQLFDNYIKLGLKASGSWGDSLEHKSVVNEKYIKASVLANKYAYWLENGRKPTAPEKRGRLYGIIKQWIEDKGIQPDDPKMSKKTLAWLIARKIDFEGIKVPNQYNSGGLVSDVITEKHILNLSDSIKGVISLNFKSSIIEKFKK
jgi:hypothetical protein